MEYKIIGIDGKVKRYGHRQEPAIYKSKKDLLIHIKECFKHDIRLGVDDLVKSNSFLNECCHHWGEIYKAYDPYLSKTYTGLRELMIVDSYGRTLNIPDLAIEAWDIEFPKEVEYHRRSFYQSHTSEWWDDSWWWTLHIKRNKYKGHMGYNGRVKRVQQERRISCDGMHQPFVRGKRTKHALDPWGLIENGPKAQITWKQMKIKKQWQEKLLDRKN